MSRQPLLPLYILLICIILVIPSQGTYMSSQNLFKISGFFLTRILFFFMAFRSSQPPKCIICGTLENIWRPPHTLSPSDRASPPCTSFNVKSSPIPAFSVASVLHHLHLLM